MKASGKMTRKAFLKTAALASVLPPVADGARAQTQQTVTAGQRPLTLRNAQWQLDLRAEAGLSAQLVHSPSGITLAAGRYSYSFGAPSFTLGSVERDTSASIVTFTGLATGAIAIQHQFIVPANEPWIEEQITIGNQGTTVLALPHGRCGFVLPVSVQSGALQEPLRDFRFIAVPYRREPKGNRNQYADYAIMQVLTEPCWSNLRAAVPITHWGRAVVPTVFETGWIHTNYPFYASEGWVLTDGRRGFLISKYSQDGMEWAVLDRAPIAGDHAALRWGGFGIHEGDPEHGAWIPPQQSHSFGTTRITAFEGGIKGGFYAFRREMEARGLGCPKGFNPPVHWNELYDNKLWWLPDFGMDKPENRKKYYTLSDLKEEAAKARDIGCEALYCDPGWDTSFASKIWDEPRLGPLRDFVVLLRQQYGLSLSLHTPLSGWCDPSSYPRTIDRMNRDGSRVEMSLCGASRQYVEETYARLGALARDGVSFFMFDGTMFSGECWSPDHGHPVPSTRHDHVEATNLLARLIHMKHPNVLIEMHDQMLGGTPLRYVPTYYGQGLGLPASKGMSAPGFDSIWGFELMWDPMTDLVGGHSMALYYYNLAYSIPIYLHIDLRKDNAQCLMFWWNASTCRHLGIGGTHPDPAIHQAHKDAMSNYRRLEVFFKQGTFYGLDEMVHVHVDPARTGAVINCFNLEDHAIRRSIEFYLTQLALDPALQYEVTGGGARRTASQYVIEVDVPAYGHTRVEVHKS
jgi:hypothetical protein